MADWRVRAPVNSAELRACHDLRWRILRAPWQQPRGSEQDEFETRSFHAMVESDEGELIGTARLHESAKGRGQVRYMAVEPAFERQGVASAMLAFLETQAATQSWTEIHLNARDTAVGFYLRHGYEDVGEAPTVMNIIHRRMKKCL